MCTVNLNLLFRLYYSVRFQSKFPAIDTQNSSYNKTSLNKYILYWAFHILPHLYCICFNACSCLLKQMQYRFAVIWGPPCERKKKYVFTTVTIDLYYFIIIFVAYFQKYVFTSCSGPIDSLFPCQGCLQRKTIKLK